MDGDDPALGLIAERLGLLLPPGTAVGASRLADPACLLPAERAAITGAITARQREFAGGRMAARRALRQLGRPASAITMKPDRAPIWPAGLQGSITHAGGLCLAAVSADPQLAGLGIDLEPDDPLPSEVLAEVLLPEEGALPARLVFSAKEAVFKALYPRLGFVFGFDAVQISLSGEGFVAKTLHSLGSIAAGTRLPGRFRRGGGMILTAVAVRRQDLGLDSAASLI